MSERRRHPVKEAEQPLRLQQRQWKEQAPPYPVEQEAAQIAPLLARAALKQLVDRVGRSVQERRGEQQGDLVPGKHA